MNNEKLEVSASQQNSAMNHPNEPSVRQVSQMHQQAPKQSNWLIPAIAGLVGALIGGGAIGLLSSGSSVVSQADLDQAIERIAVLEDKNRSFEYFYGELESINEETLVGIESRARDTERKVDVNSVHAQLEAYAASVNGTYPSVANMADKTLIAENMPGLDSESLVDPSSGGYTYITTPSSCDNTTIDCKKYTLSTDLEEDGRAREDANSDLADYQKNSLY